ncbi:MAG: hypothetical protein AAF317_15375, partial [Pseudomonadota bacterium]
MIVIGLQLAMGAGYGDLELLKRPSRVCPDLVSGRRVRPGIVPAVAAEGQLSPGVLRAVEQLSISSSSRRLPL